MKLPILVTPEVRAVYNFLKRFLFIKPLKFILLGYLWEYEQLLIARKAKHAVDVALKNYKPTVELYFFLFGLVVDLHIVSRWTIDDDTSE